MLPLDILTSIVTLIWLPNPAYYFGLCCEWSHMSWTDVCGQWKMLHCRHRQHWISHRCLPHFTHIQSTVFLRNSNCNRIYTANGFLYIFLVCQCLGVFFTMESLWYSQIFTFFYHICKLKLVSSLPENLFAVTLVCCNMENKSFNSYCGYGYA